MKDMKLPKETKAGLRNRARKMRTEQTETEEFLWQLIREKKLSRYKFRRQQLIGAYIVDFYCPQAKLIVEVDGPVHDTQREYDQHREDELLGMGYRVIRFKNDEVLEFPTEVLKKILKEVQYSE